MSIRSRVFQTALVLGSILFVAPLAAQAIMYAPGATLNPACGPTDSNCGVESNTATGTAGQVPYYAAAGNVLAATSTMTILANGNLSVALSLLTKDPIADVRSFGATGDGVTDDTVAVQAAFTASKNVFFPPGTYIVSNLTVAKDGTNIYGIGPSSIVQMKTGATGTMIDAGAYAISMNYLNLYGGDDTSKKSVVASSTNQTALALHSQINSSLSHITIHGFGNLGINISDTTRDRLTHLVFSDSQIYNTFEAFLGGPNDAEDVRLSNLDINNNRYGLYLSSGNMTTTNSKINDNGYGVSVIGTNIGNNAHGNVSNSLINHSAVYSIYTENVTLGFNFIGNNIFDGDIYLATSTGITIGDGIIAINNFYLQAGGRNYIRNNHLPSNGSTDTVNHNYGSSIDQTLFQDNFYGDGTFLSNNYSLQAVGGGVGIGTTTPAAMLDITGTSTTPTIGGELITNVLDTTFADPATGNWSGTNWTYASGVETHTAGANVLTLDNTALSAAPSSGKVYRILFRVTTTAVGTISMGFGSSGAGLQGAQIPLGQVTGLVDQTQVIAATGAGPLTFTPDATWTGTIDNISIKEISVTPALAIIRNSNGTVASEFRTGGKGLESLFWGTNAGYINGIAGVGVFNIGIGQNALAHNSSGIENTVIGARSFVSNTSGGRNTIVGFGGMYSNTTSSDNTSMGAFALGPATIGGQNTVVGSSAGGAVTTGASNILIGYQAGLNLTTGSGNIIIGTNISATSSSATNSLNIGNLIFGTSINGTGTTLSNGNIGIGTTTPSSLLSVQATAGGTTPLFTIASSTAGAATSTALTVIVNGRVGIGTTSPATMFEVGTSTAANVTLDWYTNCGGFTTNANGLLSCAASDERLKQGIEPLGASSTLAALNALTPVSFYWKPDADRGAELQYGLIAQQVAGVFPNLVSTSSPTALTPDGTLTLNYDGLIAPIIVAVQELTRTVTGFAQAVTTQVLTAAEGHFTNKMCVGATCVDEAQLKELLDKTGSNTSPQAGQQSSQSAPILITDSTSSTSSEQASSPQADTASTTLP